MTAMGAAAVFSVFSAAAGGQREPLRFEAGWNHGVALAGGKQEGADVPEPDSGGVRFQVGAQHSGEFRIGFAVGCERGQDSLYVHAVESHGDEKIGRRRQVVFDAADAAVDYRAGRNQFLVRTGAANRLDEFGVHRVAGGGGIGVDGAGQGQGDRQADGQRHAATEGTRLGRAFRAGSGVEDDFRFRLILAAVGESGHVAGLPFGAEHDFQLALAGQQNVAVADVDALVVQGGGGLAEGGARRHLGGSDRQTLEFERVRIDLEIALIGYGTPCHVYSCQEATGLQGDLVSVLEESLAVRGALAVIVECDSLAIKDAGEIAAERARGDGTVADDLIDVARVEAPGAGPGGRIDASQIAAERARGDGTVADDLIDVARVEAPGAGPGVQFAPVRYRHLQTHAIGGFELKGVAGGGADGCRTAGRLRLGPCRRFAWHNGLMVSAIQGFDADVLLQVVGHAVEPGARLLDPRVGIGTGLAVGHSGPDPN